MIEFTVIIPAQGVDHCALEIWSSWFFSITIYIITINSNSGGNRQLFITYIDGLGFAGTHLADSQLHYADDILWFFARWHLLASRG